MKERGNVLTDLSGNINNGAIYGAEWSTDVPESIIDSFRSDLHILVTVNIYEH